MATAPTGSIAPSAVLLSGDRAAVRRFALRRAAISAMLTVVLVLTLGTGLMGSVIFGLLSGAVTYIGFAARGTRGLSTTRDTRSGT